MGFTNLRQRQHMPTSSSTSLARSTQTNASLIHLPNSALENRVKMQAKYALRSNINFNVSIGCTSLLAAPKQRAVRATAGLRYCDEHVAADCFEYQRGAFLPFSFWSNSS